MAKETIENSVKITRLTTWALSEMYEVDRKTFRLWLSPFIDYVGKKTGNYWTPIQVTRIFEKLGTPPNM